MALNSPALISPLRLLEEASDAIARLDTSCTHAPASASLVLRLRAIVRLAGEPAGGLEALVSGLADQGSSERIDVALAQAQRFIDDEERRARGGAPLTTARLVAAGVPSNEGLDRALRAVAARPTLLGGLHVAAQVEDRAWAGAALALILCAAGRTDRVRILPFAEIAASAWSSARAAESDEVNEAWHSLTLTHLTTRARACTAALDSLAKTTRREAADLTALGRASITARRVLAALRDTLAVTVPTLADELALSRPAASDALGRLVDLGMVREVTGRRRDRVFAYEAALAVATES